MEHLDAVLAVAMNVEEAQETESRRAIIEGSGAALKGVQKSRYWLRVMVEEANALYAVLTAIVRSATPG